jgi:hypothetical protein
MTDRADTMLRRLRMLDQLVVTADENDPDFLHVDAEALMRDAHDFRLWTLEQTEPGTWRHHESGVEGNLGNLLKAIAWTYDVDRVPA